MLERQLLRIPEAARVLGLSEHRVYELVRQGILPLGVVVKLGRQIRINSERLREWIAGGGQALPGGWRREA